MRSWAVASVLGRSSAKLRRSPFTRYCRAGNVTLRRAPVRVSHTPKPINFRPASGPSVKWSSASASFPGGLPLSFAMNVTVIMSSPFFVVRVDRGSFAPEEPVNVGHQRGGAAVGRRDGEDVPDAVQAGAPGAPEAVKRWDRHAPGEDVTGDLSDRRRISEEAGGSASAVRPG